MQKPPVKDCARNRICQRDAASRAGAAEGGKALGDAEAAYADVGRRE
jgi:hypothetical protein